MSRLGWFLVTVGAVGLVGGCQTNHVRTQVPTPVVASRTDAAGAAESPDWRRERERRALRGLCYDSGRVEVEDGFAATVAPRGDRAAAAAEHARGVALLAENRQLEAATAFTRAVIMTPDEAEFYAGLGARADVSRGLR